MAKIRDVLLVLCLIIIVFYFGGFIIFPILFSIFGALTLLPVVKFFRKLGLNNLLSVLVVVLLVSALVTVVFGFISYGSYQLVSSMGENNGSMDFESFWEGLKSELYSTFGWEDTKNAITNVTDKALSASSKYLKYIFSGVKSTVMFFSLTPIYIFFILYYRENLKHFLNSNEDHTAKKKDIRMINEIKEMVQKYLSGLLLVMVIVSTLNAISLFAFGIEYAIIIGLITGFLIIIPYIGVFIGAAIPVTIAFLTKDSMVYPLGILACYVVIQFIEGNYITPKIIGDSVNVNPLIIILSIMILGALGGVLAMIIAIPLVGTIKIYLDNSNYSQYSILLSNKISKEQSLSNLK